jgi:hypothetical protein
MDFVTERLTLGIMPPQLSTISAYHDTRSAFLVIALAVRAFKIERGDYPNDLAELVPEYLSEVPIDPYSDNQPLRYKRQDGDFLLYSVGPDCRDDGGRPWNREPGRESCIRIPAMDSKGDIVYGVECE